jgi:hypothetical protein
MGDEQSFFLIFSDDLGTIDSWLAIAYCHLFQDLGLLLASSS